MRASQANVVVDLHVLGAQGTITAPQIVAVHFAHEIGLSAVGFGAQSQTKFAAVRHQISPRVKTTTTWNHHSPRLRYLLEIDTARCVLLVIVSLNTFVAAVTPSISASLERSRSG